MNWLDELEALEKAATPGPWRTGPINYADIYGPEDLLALATKDRPGTVDDAQLICLLRNAAPRLIAIARAAQEYVWTIYEETGVAQIIAFDALRKALEAK